MWFELLKVIIQLVFVLFKESLLLLIIAEVFLVLLLKVQLGAGFVVKVLVKVELLVRV